MVQPVDQEPMTYDDFRTGLTFREVREELKQEQREALGRGLYKFVTRRTVLGRWTQHKRSMYGDYSRWMRGY